MTTRECLHLVTGSYFRSRKKDGGHAIRSVLWPWPWPDDFHILTWPVLPGDTPNVRELLLTDEDYDDDDDDLYYKSS